MGLLKDKIAVVVGGTSGIGAEAARLFAAEGAKVVVTGRRRAEGEAVADSIVSAGNEAWFFEVDVASSASVNAMIEAVLSRYGRIDCAFNNFGISDGHRALVDQDEQTWDEVIDVNLKGGFNCLKAQLPVMYKQGSGSIVFTSSVLAQVFVPGESIYSASKGGLESLAKAAALESADKGVRVNIVSPGLTRTPMTEGSFRMNDEKGYAEHPFAAAHPIGRTGEPNEIAEAALFLLSDRASFVTGQMLSVDGGYTIK
jgi:NAD(P)-dependent dehydrogenase (short-subunit alcohol dehydrogenase family)